jgi:SP family general alpha glucoside:H+ symporter-like MFS transporter
MHTANEPHKSAPGPMPEKATSIVQELEDLTHGAKLATDREKRMSIREAISKYPKATAYSMILSLCIIMEGYDVSVYFSFILYSLP